MENKWTPYLMVLPAFLVIAIFVAYPVFNSLVLSFTHPETGQFTWDNYSYFFTDDIQQANILYTLKIVFETVIFTGMIGFFLALYLRFSNSWIAKVIGKLTLFPRFIPGLVAVQSVLVLIMDGGVVSRIASLFGLNFNLGWMYSEKAILFMNLWFNIPFSTLIILASLSNVKDSYIEAARDIGSSHFDILKKIILPLSYKDILVAMTFVFMSNIGSFTTPYLLGGTHPRMLGIALYDQFNAYMSYERAAALSAIMFVFSLGAAIVYVTSNLKESRWQKG